METHSSILAWEIPWTEESGRLQSMGSAPCRTSCETPHWRRSSRKHTRPLHHREMKAIFSDECRKKLTLIVDIETFEFLKKDKDDFKCNGWVKDPQPDDLATIIYTSGTT